ncbi:cadherin-related family member 1-like [Ruditapes philippinarum]|uniref:cadherin-related family member 1-like n=1 Tax=Ruditapes philippinarum TaxID=129788 RepID=UPI00295B5372|nr:cadherin-related family member 1-like [Ruditapes philippinarum]
MMLCLIYIYYRFEIMLRFLSTLGYANAGSPYIAESIPDSSYSSQYENFNGTVCKLHIKDSDGNDHIRVKPDSDDTRIYFSFEPENGTNDVWINIITKQDLDRETLGGTINIKLIITDDQHNEIKYEHLVYILDVNDNAPKFYNLPYTLKIDELPCNNNNNTIVYDKIKANDIDNGKNGTVTYSMKPIAQTPELEDVYKKKFSIDVSTGDVSLEECLDYETNSYYQFNVIATDGGPNGGKSSSAELIIRVQDVQDMPPFFTGLPYMMTAHENIKNNASLIKVAAKDGDTGVSNRVSYSISGMFVP